MQKRLETYVTFKCNNNCLFCVEKEKKHLLNKHIPFKDKQHIANFFKKYKKDGYNHINLLGGEPFLVKNLAEILQMAKKNNFKIALATNGSLLADKKIAQSTLPFIDDLIISIHGHNQKLMARLSQNKTLYKNIITGLANVKRYFKGRLLKVNCVINKLNHRKLMDILKFIQGQGIKEINFTSLDIKDFNKQLAINFSKIKGAIKPLVEYAIVHNIILKFAEIPLCVLGEHYYLANDLFWEPREKFEANGKKDDHFERNKIKPPVCSQCSKEKICPGLDSNYYYLYGSNDLNPA